MTLQTVALQPTDARRPSAISAFLNTAGWDGAELLPLKGDASFRRYIRLKRGDRTAMLMDAPPEKENVVSYVRVARYLHGIGHSTPEIYAEDTHQGLVLSEDLGDDLFTALLGAESAPADEASLYDAAIDVLAAWHAEPRLRKSAAALNLPDYSVRELMREVSLFADWYLPQALGTAKASGLRDEYIDLWEKLLERAALPCDAFVHRDFHADNLIWLPGRKSTERVGLLDFQDALWGHPAYDLISLLEDARRDVPEPLYARCMERYLAASGEDKEAFTAACAILAAQRNTKIVGIFVRLAQRDGKHAYLKFLPRVWQHLERDLHHPQLAEIREWTDRHVPFSARGVIAVHA